MVLLHRQVKKCHTSERLQHACAVSRVGLALLSRRLARFRSFNKLFGYDITKSFGYLSQMACCKALNKPFWL